MDTFDNHNHIQNYLDNYQHNHIHNYSDNFQPILWLCIKRIIKEGFIKKLNKFKTFKTFTFAVY